MKSLTGHSRPAFSLVETVLSTVIAVIVMGTLSVSINALTYGPTKMAHRARLRQQAELIMQRIATELAAAKVINHVIEIEDRDRTLQIRFAIAEGTTGITDGDLEDDPNKPPPDSKLEHPATSPYEYTQYLDLLRYEWLSQKLIRRRALSNSYNPDIPEDTWTSDSSILALACPKMYLALECEILRVGQQHRDERVPELVYTGDVEGRTRLLAALEEAEIIVRNVYITLTIEDEDTAQTITIYRAVNCPNEPRLLGFEALPENEDLG